MTKQTKQYMVMGAICLFICAAVVWASNNVDAVENAIG